MWTTGRRQHPVGRVHDEDCEELGGLDITGIGADTVVITGHFDEALADAEDLLRAVVDPAAHRTLDHSCRDEGRRGVGVGR
jgi:hypothetical protein